MPASRSQTYPYYDAARRHVGGIDFAGMRAALEAAAQRHHRRAARLLPQPDRL